MNSVTNTHSVLFLSANDFKGKSIQVIRKTPEAFVAAGWKVTYIVARDRSKAGNYYYEKEINPAGVDVIRFDMPLSGLRSLIRNHFLLTVVTQFAAWMTIFKLAKRARKFLRSSENKVDVIYGYEVHGVCAVDWMRRWGRLKQMKIVSRFQGTWMTSYLRKGKWLKKILNIDDVIALKSRADLCIMTNDGTDGDEAMRRLKSKALHNLKFWINGVDEQKLRPDAYSELKSMYNPDGTKCIVLSVSRMESWKRVDRILDVISCAVKKHGAKNLLYIAAGEGSMLPQYQHRINLEGLGEYVVFTGAVPHEEVKKYLNLADVFISTYDLSNVGNPLLEAIRANKIIFTLNNGATGEWIHHQQNGFIYDIDENMIENMATDLVALMQDESLKNRIRSNVGKTEKEKLWTWQERMEAEVKAVESIVETS